MMHDTKGSFSRPLSPHLQIYRPQMTSLLSISHRLTGLILSSGCLLLVGWLWAIAQGKETYAIFYGVCGLLFAKLYLFTLLYAFFYHLCNGLRHLAWDAGYGFDLKQVHQTGWAVILASGILTFIVWFALWLGWF